MPFYMCNYSSAYAPGLDHSLAIFDAACKLVTPSSSCILGVMRGALTTPFCLAGHNRIFFFFFFKHVPCLKRNQRMQSKLVCSLRNTPCSTACSSCLCLLINYLRFSVLDTHLSCRGQLSRSLALRTAAAALLGRGPHGVPDPASAATSLCRTPWILPGSSQHVSLAGEGAAVQSQRGTAAAPQGAPPHPLTAAARQTWQDVILDNVPLAQVETCPCCHALAQPPPVPAVSK